MTKIIIQWKHFDKDGSTCNRCSKTGDNIQQVIRGLQKEFEIEFVETKLTEDQMSESNQVIINGKLLEDIIPNTKAGENYCNSCSDLIGKPGDCHCRTLTQGEKIFEDIPQELIKSAILKILNLEQITSSNKNNIMKIQVFGSGCPTCKTLYEFTQTAVKELGIDAEVEYSTDISKIIELGVMESPVMTIDGKIAMLGSGNLEKVKNVISKATGNTQESCCSCGSKC